MLVTMIVWRRKIVSGSCLRWLEIILTFVGVGDVSSHYKSFPLRYSLRYFLRYSLRLTSVSTFFSSLRDSESRCEYLLFLTMKVDFRITSGNFRGSLKFNLMQFLLTGTSHGISFSYSSILPVSEQFWPWCYVQHHLFITFIRNMKFQYPKNLWVVKNN